MYKCPYVHMSMSMSIWTFRHIYIRTCCRDAGCDYILSIVLKILTRNKKKHREFVCLFRCIFTLDVLSHQTFCPYTLCPSRRFVRIHFVTVYLMSFQTFCLNTFCHIIKHFVVIPFVVIRSVLQTFCRYMFCRYTFCH